MPEEESHILMEAGNSSIAGHEERHLNIQVQIEPAESYAYSNLAGVSMTPWDIRINFAEFLPTRSAPDEKSKAKTVAGIVVSPEHAASLVLILIRQLVSFEQSIGPIRNVAWRRLADRVLEQPVPDEETDTEG